MYKSWLKLKSRELDFHPSEVKECWDSSFTCPAYMTSEKPVILMELLAVVSVLQDQVGQKALSIRGFDVLRRANSRGTSWCMPVIPADREAEAGGLQTESQEEPFRDSIVNKESQGQLENFSFSSSNSLIQTFTV